VRLRVLIVGVTAAILVALGGHATSQAVVGDCTPQASWGTDLTAIESQVIDMVNQHRVAMGLNALVPAPSLVASAEYKSMNMAGYLYMDHDDPAPVARGIGDRFIACGYPAGYAWGENIAYGFVDAQSVMAAWLSDIGHKANIENTSWTTIGVGVAQASNGLIFWTQDFGTTGTVQQPPPPNDTQAPTVPSALTAVPSSGTTVALSWHASTDNYAVSGYDVYLNGSKLGTTGVTTGTIGGLQCGTMYTFSVDAYDPSGNKSAAATTQAATQSCSGPPPIPPPPGGDTQAPSIPAGIGTNNITQASVDLSWLASNDDVGVAGYTVYVDGAVFGTVNKLGDTITGLDCGLTYTVGVDAFDAAGNHSLPSSTSVTTGACVPTDDPPSAPGNVTASPASRQAIAVSWSSSTDDVKVVGYTIYINGTPVKTTGHYATSTKANTLACGTTYTIGVDAFDASGNHSAVSTAWATTLPCRTVASA
jgi:uncharacterized protein YkwD/chitodextrinase